MANYRIKRGKTKVGVAVTLLISFRFKCDRWVIITLKLRDVLFISISCLRIVSNSLICHLWNLKRLVIITETAINCLLPSSSEINIQSTRPELISDNATRNMQPGSRKLGGNPHLVLKPQHPGNRVKSWARAVKRDLWIYFLFVYNMQYSRFPEHAGLIYAQCSRIPLTQSFACNFFEWPTYIISLNSYQYFAVYITV